MLNCDSRCVLLCYFVQVEMSERRFVELFPAEDIIFLTPDSPNGPYCRNHNIYVFFVQLHPDFQPALYRAHARVFSNSIMQSLDFSLTEFVSSVGRARPKQGVHHRGTCRPPSAEGEFGFFRKHIKMPWLCIRRPFVRRNCPAHPKLEFILVSSQLLKVLSCLCGA